MSILKNTLTALSRGLPSQSSRGRSSLQESKKPNGDGLTVEERTSLAELKFRLLNTLLQLCGKDQILIGMVRKLVIPILSNLSLAQIEEGANFIHAEIEALKNAGL